VGRRVSKKSKIKKACEVCDILNHEYGTDLRCYLKYDPEKPWQLLFATIMSAQCTDDRVNMVTEELYKKYPTLESVAAADVGEFGRDIYSTGFYRNKARNIVACAGVLVQDYGGELPRTMEELVALPGVGRKTANVIMGNIYREPSVVVDTHVKRVSKRLGLTDTEDPEKAEYELREVLPRDQWILYNLQVIAHGREVCKSQRPRCAECVLREMCEYAGQNP